MHALRGEPLLLAELGREVPVSTAGGTGNGWLPTLLVWNLTIRTRLGPSL